MKWKWKWKRPAACLLAAAMMVTMSGVPASAVETDVSGVSGSAPAECSCETHCEQGAVNPDCPVCAAEDADLSACLGKEAAIAALAALAAAQGEIALYADDINKPRNGTGTTEDPYQITSTDEMEWFRDTVNAGNTTICAELMSDLNFSDKQSNGNWTWTPIGNSEDNAYVGMFDGNGYEIKEIRLVDVQAQSQTNRGLFGWIGTGGKVQDLAVSVKYVGNSSLSVSDSGLLSVNNAGTIERCSATISSALYTGSFGMIAYENRGEITDCLSYVSATGNKLSISDKAAGIARTNTGTISNCFFRGSFRTGKTDYAIAENKNGSITNCYYRDANNGRNGEVYIDGNKGTGDTVVWKSTSECNSGEVAWLLNNSGSRDTWRMGSNKYPSLKKTDGRVNKNQDGSYNIGDKPHMHGDVEFTKVAALSDIKATGNYYIDAAVNVDNTWSVKGNVVLCLNGQTVTDNNGTDPAIEVSGNNSLTLLACNGGKITGSGGTSILVDGGSLTLGGKAQITGNAKNILLTQGSKISFDSLDPSAKFGISVENQKDLSDPVAVTDATGGQYFGQLVADGFKDNGVGFELYLSDDGKTVMLGKQSAHTHCICGGRNTNLGHTSHSDVTFQPWRETDKLPTSGNYYLTRNVTLTKNATLQNANVCLNGYTVTLSNVGRIMSSGTTQLTDCSVGGKLESYSGKANGGVAISNGNTFCLYGGTFNGVKVEIGQTGGGTFNMYGGKITGNTKGTVVGQSKTSKNTTITINMYGGEISGNHISENQGGGVFVGSGNQFNMYGGTIQNNSAVDGGGVYIAPAYNAYSAGEMTICGDAVIQGNNKAGGVTNNVSLPSGKQITISGELVKNANIGVTTRANLLQGNVNIATATDAGWVVAKNFTSDNSAYDVGLVNDGKTVQLQVHSHQWKYTANGATITAKCSQCGASGGSVTIKAPAELTYSGEGKPATVTASSDWQGPAASGITISYIKTGKYGPAMLENGALPTNAGEYTASITVGGATASETWSLNAKEVILNWGNITDRKWKDGKTVTATVSNKVGNDEVDVTVTGGDQTAVGSPHTATAVGLTGAQAGNYRLPADKEQTYSIGKADARKLLDITVSQKQSVTTKQSKDIGRAGMPADAGNLTYAVGSESTTGSASVTASMTGSTVKFTITGGANGDVITLPVTIGSDNYADSIVNVVITLTNKDTPTVTVKDITVTYDGNAIPDSKITGKATFNGNTVEGTWGFKTTAPKFVADSNDSVAVVFTPNDATTYAAVETNIKVTINKATPTGTPTYTAITTSGKKLSDAALAIGSITPAGGTIKWDLGDAMEVTANTAYGWTYTLADVNYDKLTGSITPYVVSASSGGGASGGGGGAAPAPTPDDSDVITVKEDTKDNTTSKPGAETDTTTTTKTTVKNTTTETTKNEQGQDVSKTTASVSKDLGDKLLDQAVSNKSDTIEITVKSSDTNNGSGAGSTGAADSVKATEVELPKVIVNAIAKDTNADLVIKTDNGEVVLDNKTLETIAGAANGDTVTIVVGENTQLKETQKPAEKIVGKNGTLFDLVAKIGEKHLHQFEGGKAYVILPMPDKLKGKDILVIYIDDNGLCKILNHSVVKIGAEYYIRFTTPHFSTFAVVDKDEAEGLIKEQNAAHVKELMQSAKFKVTTTKTSKKSVKVQVAAKSSKTMISDIKSLGYTVKYQFYRSTKKTAGYKLFKTSSKNSFISTKGTKGRKYYYKARMLVYDGKTLVAKSALRQCSYGARTWIK